MNTLKKIILIIIIIALIGACGLLVYQFVKSKTEEIKNPLLTLEVEDYGNIEIELYPEYAPNTVKSIICLAQTGYYDGKSFFEKDDISVYAGRDENGKLVTAKLSDLDESISEEEDYEYGIKGEFAANGFDQNTLKHERGTVSLALTNYMKIFPSLKEETYNSGNSSFVILVKDAKTLNGMYSAFGKVVNGMEIVDKIYELEENEKTDDNTETGFVTKPIIKKATIETYGIDYGKPETQEAFDEEAFREYINQIQGAN